MKKPRGRQYGCGEGPLSASAVEGNDAETVRGRAAHDVSEADGPSRAEEPGDLLPWTINRHCANSASTCSLSFVHCAKPGAFTASSPKMRLPPPPPAHKTQAGRGLRP